MSVDHDFQCGWEEEITCLEVIDRVGASSSRFGEISFFCEIGFYILIKKSCDCHWSATNGNQQSLVPMPDACHVIGYLWSPGPTMNAG